MIYLYVLKLKTKWFNRWSRKNKLSDSLLLETIENLDNNLSTVSLGKGLYKVRTPKIGRGKSGGYRTIIVFKKSKLAVFVYAFAKNEKDNLDKEELSYFRKLAVELLSIRKQEYLRLVKVGAIFRLREGNEKKNK